MDYQNQNIYQDVTMQESQSSTTPEPKKKKKISWFYYFILVCVFLIWLSSAILVLIFNKKYKAFESTSNISAKTLVSMAQTGYQKSQLYPEENKIETTILLLGVDTLENRGDVPPLTDTMMIVRIHFDSATINILSLPRDIWSEAYQTKINALLAYGYEKDPNDPTKFPSRVISELTNIHIDHTLVLSLEQLEELIDVVGGIEVDVKEGFTDNEFPRADVDIETVTDPALLYETVTFYPGLQIMSGDNALKYIRSRKSADEEGNDIARGERQQEVFRAFFNKVANYQYFYDNPDVGGEIISFYNKNYSQALSLVDLFATLSAIFPNINKLNIVGQTLSTDPSDPNGVLYNPPDFYYENLWVYTIKNIDDFRNEVFMKLNAN